MVWYRNYNEIKLKIENIIAGNDVTKNTLSKHDLPNKAPEACPIRVIDLINDDVPASIIKFDKTCEINVKCIESHVGCDGSDENYVDLNTKISYMECQYDNKRNNNIISNSIFLADKNVMIITILMICCLCFYIIYYKLYIGYFKNQEYTYVRLK